MTKPDLTANEMDVLESIIDRMSVSDVLYAVEAICLSKADHVRANWQDEGLAKEWEHRAAVLSKAAQKV